MHELPIGAGSRRRVCILYMKRVIHWFRRDLRVHDNTALRAALEEAEEVVPVFVLSDWKRAHPWVGEGKREFLLGSLAVLVGNIEKIGGKLVIRQGEADKELGKLLEETKAEAIFFNRDPDTYGRKMEEKIAKLAETRAFKDVAIHERDEVLTGKGQPFRVFTPYARAWRSLAKPKVHGAPRRMKTPAGIRSIKLPAMKSGVEIIEPGEEAARKRLAAFVKGAIDQYAELRDFPAAEGTSRLSQDLRFGLLSPREVFEKAAEAKIYTNELIWREFYMQVLWHWPEVLERDFNPEYRNVKWFRAGEDFEAWKNGETGFPIVDAAMRQLNQTGFMHNRLRMIVAMFLTKDLHIHWKTGEQYFYMQRLGRWGDREQ